MCTLTQATMPSRWPINTIGLPVSPRLKDIANVDVTLIYRHLNIKETDAAKHGEEKHTFTTVGFVSCPHTRMIRLMNLPVFISFLMNRYVETRVHIKASMFLR